MNGDTLMLWLDQHLMMLAFLGSVIFIDLVGGILVALKSGSFDLEKLPDFLKSALVFVWAWISAELLELLPKLFGVEIAGLGGMLSQYTGDAVYAFVALKYVASILGHISETGILNGQFRRLGIYSTSEKDSRG